MDAKVVAQQIFEALGGNENIISLVYCATRLRFVLNDDSVVDENKLAQITEVTGTFRTGGQYQIVLGMGKVKLYQFIMSQFDLTHTQNDLILTTSTECSCDLSDLCQFIFIDH